MYSLASASAKAPLVVCRARAKSTNDTTSKKVVHGASRRQLVGGTAALLVSQLPRPALADEVISYTEGPEGIMYTDVTVGKGESPFEGDARKCCKPLLAVVKVNYVLNVDGKKADYSKFFVFSAGQGEVIKGYDMLVLGSGDMPPMKVGGTRKALIPPSMGYGSRAQGCRGDGSECLIPADSILEFTIELVGFK